MFNLFQLITFLLNNTIVATELKPASTLLDFIRYNKRLTGTKIGCREGDCGACSVLVGEVVNDQLVYSNVTSCLMPLGNAHLKHIVTVEGLNLENGLNAVQHSFAVEGATQCGFCTPGFIVALSGYAIGANAIEYNKAIEAINGNICRCTGYKSIERAVHAVIEVLSRRGMRDPIEFGVQHNFIPPYFLSVKHRLLHLEVDALPTDSKQSKKVGGGTDLYVQQHDTIVHEDVMLLLNRPELKYIHSQDSVCEMGGAITAADLSKSEVFLNYFPRLDHFIKLVSSSPIRNMATIAGNFINASPIGDFSVFFLALNAQLHLTGMDGERIVYLRDFYKGYKQLDKLPDEVLTKVSFCLPAQGSFFNFEKVCKRTHLDIASVNSALQLELQDGIISKASLSAGGVAPFPLYLAKSSSYLIGKVVNAAMFQALIEIIQEEISPISDVRGTADYKRLLLSQLVKAHFISFFPHLQNELLAA